MISILSHEYSFLNLLMVCIQLIIPLIIYLIAFMYVSDEQSSWYNNLSFIHNNNLIKGNKGMFLGCLVFFFTGIASTIVLDYYYRMFKGDDRSNFKGIFTDLVKNEHSNLHFYLFPVMVLLTNLGLPIAYQLESFLCHIIFNFIALVINLYLMFYYCRRLSYVVTILLTPLLAWQIFNICLYINTTT